MPTGSPTTRLARRRERLQVVDELGDRRPCASPRGARSRPARPDARWPHRIKRQGLPRLAHSSCTLPPSVTHEIRALQQVDELLVREQGKEADPFVAPQPREEPEPGEPRFGRRVEHEDERPPLRELQEKAHDRRQPPATVQVLDAVNRHEAVRVERPRARGCALQAEGQRLHDRVAAHPDTPVAEPHPLEVRGRPLRRREQDVRPAHDQYPDQLLGERVQVVVGAQARLDVGDAQTRPSREHHGQQRRGRVAVHQADAALTPKQRALEVCRAKKAVAEGLRHPGPGRAEGGDVVTDTERCIRLAHQQLPAQRARERGVLARVDQVVGDALGVELSQDRRGLDVLGLGADEDVDHRSGPRPGASALPSRRPLAGFEAQQLGASALDALHGLPGAVLDPAQSILDVLDQPAVDRDEVREQRPEEHLGTQADAEGGQEQQPPCPHRRGAARRRIARRPGVAAPASSRHAPINAKKRNGR